MSSVLADFGKMDHVVTRSSGCYFCLSERAAVGMQSRYAVTAVIYIGHKVGAGSAYEVLMHIFLLHKS